MGTFYLPGTTINLFAVILGDLPASERTFLLEAKPGDSVGTLKKNAHAENQDHFKGVDATKLILWKVLPLRSFRCIIC
jgi:hypothetical protein